MTGQKEPLANWEGEDLWRTHAGTWAQPGIRPVLNANPCRPDVLTSSIDVPWYDVTTSSGPRQCVAGGRTRGGWFVARRRQLDLASMGCEHAEVDVVAAFVAAVE